VSEDCKHNVNIAENKSSNFRIIIKLKTGNRTLTSFLDSGSDISLIKSNVANSAIALSAHVSSVPTDLLDSDFLVKVLAL
jgi:hypothetical protein